MITFPSEEILNMLATKTPDYMFPNKLPYVIIFESFLNDFQCATIYDELRDIEPHHFPGCNATTRENGEWSFHSPLSTVEHMVRNCNNEQWMYDIRHASAYMQTYEVNDFYPRHMDGFVGQTRKLTAIVQLSNPSDYIGGNLTFYVPGSKDFVPPNKRGTIYIFPHWLIHGVTPVIQGTRHSINMGFWGPSFV